MQFINPFLFFFAFYGWCYGLRPKTVQPEKGHCQHGIDAFARTEAGDYDYNVGISAYNTSEGSSAVGSIAQGDMLGFYNVNFREGACGIHLRVASGIALFRPVQIHLHLDSPRSPPFVTIDIGSTGGYRSYYTLSLYLPYVPKGMHDLYFTFSDQYASKSVVDVSWFQFFTSIIPLPSKDETPVTVVP